MMKAVPVFGVFVSGIVLLIPLVFGHPHPSCVHSENGKTTHYEVNDKLELYCPGHKDETYKVVCTAKSSWLAVTECHGMKPTKKPTSKPEPPKMPYPSMQERKPRRPYRPPMPDRQPSDQYHRPDSDHYPRPMYERESSSYEYERYPMPDRRPYQPERPRMPDRRPHEEYPRRMPGRPSHGQDHYPMPDREPYRPPDHHPAPEHRPKPDHDYHHPTRKPEPPKTNKPAPPPTVYTTKRPKPTPKYVTKATTTPPHIIPPANQVDPLRQYKSCSTKSVSQFLPFDPFDPYYQSGTSNIPSGGRIVLTCPGYNFPFDAYCYDGTFYWQENLCPATYY